MCTSCPQLVAAAHAGTSGAASSNGTAADGTAAGTAGLINSGSGGGGSGGGALSAASHACTPPSSIEAYRLTLHKPPPAITQLTGEAILEVLRLNADGCFLHVAQVAAQVAHLAPSPQSAAPPPSPARAAQV